MLNLRHSLERPAQLYATVFLLSIALSVWSYLQSGLINKDGIIYITVAEQYVSGGLSAAFAAFNWPLYGVLIGIVHQATQLDFEQAAHVLNGLLVAITCVSFVAIYRELNHEGTRPWFAGLLVLCLPILNDYRGFVIRDFGYWAFALLAILFFLRNAKQPRLTWSVLWQLALLVAVAFRIEGIAFLAAPALHLAKSHATITQRMRTMFQASFLVVFLGGVGLLAALIFNAPPAARSVHTLELWLSYVSPSSVVAAFHAQAAQLHEQLQYLSSTSEAGLILASGLLVLAIFKISKNAVLPLLLVAAYGYRKNWLRAHPARAILTYFFVLACLTTLAILASKYFLSSRYTVLAVLILSLITVPYLDIAFQRFAGLKRRHWTVIAWALVAIMFLDGVISTGASKAPVKQGALWALDNLDATRPWLCNEVRLRFYTGGRCEYLGRDEMVQALTQAGKGSDTGYALLWVGRKDTAVSNAIATSGHLQLIEKMENQRGDFMAIYKIDGIPRAVGD